MNDHDSALASACFEVVEAIRGSGLGLTSVPGGRERCVQMGERLTRALYLRLESQVREAGFAAITRWPYF